MQEKKKRRPKGDGSSGWVTIRGHKYWRIYFRGETDGVTGKPLIKPIYGKTKAEAEEKLRQLMGDITPLPQSNVKFGPFFHDWLWNVKKRTVKSSTFESLEIIYRNHILPLKGLHNKNITKMDISYMQSVADTLLQAHAVATVRRSMSAIRNCLDYAIQQGIIQHNPVRNIEYSRGDEEQLLILDTVDSPDFATIEQQKQIIDAAKGTIYEGIIMCGILAGLRSSEIFALTENDIKFAEKYISVTKQVRFIWDGKYTDAAQTKKEYERKVVTPKTPGSVRRVPLADTLAEVIKRRIAINAANKLRHGADYHDTGLIFCNEYGHFVGNNSPNNAFRKIVKKLGLPDTLHFHSTRNMFVTNCINNSVNIKTLMEWTGHSEAKILMMHAEHNKEKNREEYAKINNLF